MDVLKFIGGCFGIAVLVAGISLLVSLVVRLVWNWIIPDVFGGPTVTVLQMWGILFLLGIIKSGLQVKSSN